MSTPIVKIASLSIETDALIKELQATKKGIAEITSEQKKLKASGGETSEAFIRNEAELKKLRGEYNSQIKVLQVTSNANDTLTEALGKEVRSIDEAIANNKELRSVRNQLNAETEEGAEAIREINDAINANTEFINENGSRLEQLKNNVGNYRDDIRGAFDDLNIFNGGLGGFISKSQEAGGAGALMKTTFTTIKTGIIGATQAGLAFIATPIGAAIAAIAATVGIFVGLIKNATSRSEDAGAKLDQVFGAVKGVANALLTALQPLGEFLIDGIVWGFEMAMEAASAFRKIAAGVLDAIGFDGLANSVRDFDNAINDALKNGAEYVKLQNEFDKAQRIAEKTQLEFQNQAEKLRQIRDNTNLTIKERYAANDQLTEVLKNQIRTELELAQAAVRLADARIVQEGNTKEALDQQAEALLKIVEIEERITSQESEALTNRVALQKEAADKAKEYAQNRAAQQEKELELYKAQNKLFKASEQELYNQQKEFAEKEIELLDSKLKRRLISETEYALEKQNIANELTAAQILIEDAEIQRLADFENRKRDLENEIILSKIVDKKEAEQVRIDQEYEAHLLELENIELKETEKTELLLLLEEQRRLALDELDAEYTELAAERNKEKVEKEKALEDERVKAKQATLDAIINLVGGETKIGKAALLAKQLMAAQEIAIDLGLFTKKASLKLTGATVDVAAGTVKSAAAAPFPANLPLIAGFVASVAGIIGTIKSAISQGKSSAAVTAERGALLSGKRHSQGGIHLEAEDGEAVINRNSTAKYLPLLSAINQDGGGVPFMEAGGIAGSVSGASPSLIDYDLLAGKIAAANASLPNPIVSVEEFSSVASRVATVENSKDF
ncbi:phage tail tape measure protein [Cellulophaga phage phi46:1]|uniref:phage tail tape measure protein n=1 Tax=Cellulophaga phage phi46:1 TaxID=1327974 RepID=UPI000351C999|nr:phage tail tape measure protein [Cellulophaga phage phi46:1]AGO47832.1 phage tail tape measure protein [Cellulophaga phage phi46:1]